MYRIFKSANKRVKMLTKIIAGLFLVFAVAVNCAEEFTPKQQAELVKLLQEFEKTERLRLQTLARAQEQQSLKENQGARNFLAELSKLDNLFLRTRESLEAVVDGLRNNGTDKVKNNFEPVKDDFAEFAKFPLSSGLKDLYAEIPAHLKKEELLEQSKETFLDSVQKIFDIFEVMFPRAYSAGTSAWIQEYLDSFVTPERVVTPKY